MKVLVTKEFWADGVFINVFGTDVGIRLEGVTGVGVASQSNSCVSLRFYRSGSVLGSFTFPIDKAVGLAVQLKSLGVYIDGTFDVMEVA